MQMKRYGDALIILSFALLHAAAAIICRALGVGDSTILTVLTMIMTVILCVRGKFTVEVSAISIILVNIIGYVLGIAAASAIGIFVKSAMSASALSTFLTTELLGWGLVALRRMFPEPKDTDAKISWIIFTVAAMLAARLLIGGVFSPLLFEGESLYGVLRDYVSNTVALLLLLSSTVLFIQFMKKDKEKRTIYLKILAYTVFFFLVSAITSLVVIFMAGGTITGVYFTELLVVGFICEVAVFSFTYLVDYALSASYSMKVERDKANQAKSQYINLKNQVNPHFLFNSLNILDYLVAEEKTVEARDYIRKLSGLYRYMLRNENEPLVQLSDELEYARMYAELVKLRFTDGLEIKYDIADGDMNRYVATFSVQMLLENAIKHNAVSPDVPLVISVTSDGESVRVVNNLVPKLSPVESTGVGLDYIRQNYHDRSGKDIQIVKTDKIYSVSLPLL